MCSDGCFYDTKPFFFADVDLDVLSIPKRGMPPDRIAAIFRVIDAHRQLCLSPYLQDFRGVDSEFDTDNMMILFDTVSVCLLQCACR